MGDAAHPRRVEISPAAVDRSHGPCRSLPVDAAVSGCARAKDSERGHCTDVPDHDTAWDVVGDTAQRWYRGHQLVVIDEGDGTWSWQTWGAGKYEPIDSGDSKSSTFARAYAEEAAERGDGPATLAGEVALDLTDAVDGAR